jgi:hypothetical protein
LAILNGAAKLVGLKLDEGPYLLNGYLATVTINLEGFELLALIVVDGHPPPIGLSLLPGVRNGVLANFKPRLAKAHVPLGCVSSNPL